MPTPQIDLLISCLEENPDERPRHAGDLVDRLTMLLHAAKTPAAEVVASVAPAAEYVPRRLTNSLQMTLLLIGPGVFRMGSPATEVERSADEGPQREVTISQPFFASIYPVTQRQFEMVVGHNPSYFHSGRGGGPDHPVERISWDEAVAFCRRLSELPAEKTARRQYRLPTEAEWEFACRAGQTSAFAFGPGLSSREANFNGNYPLRQGRARATLSRTHHRRVASPIRQTRLASSFMHGNVWEWCALTITTALICATAQPSTRWGRCTGSSCVVRRRTVERRTSAVFCRLQLSLRRVAGQSSAGHRIAGGDDDTAGVSRVRIGSLLTDRAFLGVR